MKMLLAMLTILFVMYGCSWGIAALVTCYSFWFLVLILPTVALSFLTLALFYPYTLRRWKI